MIRWMMIWNESERNGSCLIVVLSQQLSWVTDENHDKPQSGKLMPWPVFPEWQFCEPCSMQFCVCKRKALVTQTTRRHLIAIHAQFLQPEITCRTVPIIYVPVTSVTTFRDPGNIASFNRKGIMTYVWKRNSYKKKEFRIRDYRRGIDWLLVILKTCIHH